MADRRIRPARGTPEDWVVLTHPTVEGTQRCHPRAVAHWEARGWKRADAPPAPDTKKAPAAPVRAAGGSEG